MHDLALSVAILIGISLPPLNTTVGAQQSPACRIADNVSPLPELPEASGLAASRSTPGVFWSHNDSGAAIVYALAASGAVKGRVRVTGAQVTDWEDLALGPCPKGTCLYIADIGDNNGNRRAITIYRTPEPTPADGRTEDAEALHATYPDGPHDAEAFIVLPGGDMFIVTKGEKGAVALYRFPGPFRNGATVALARVGVLIPAQGKAKNGAVGKNRRITGAGASGDGRWIVLRAGTAVMFYDAREFVAGTINEAFRYDVIALREPQGEGVALSANGDVWLTGEGGGNSRPGTLARLSCTLR
jgi:hypothetical protein